LLLVFHLTRFSPNNWQHVYYVSTVRMEVFGLGGEAKCCSH
jgi:hypothetical protein